MKTHPAVLSTLAALGLLFCGVGARATIRNVPGSYAGLGGAVAIVSGSVATITDCAFLGNSATYSYPGVETSGGNGGFGGGVFINNGSSATITNCIFSRNSTSYFYDGVLLPGFGGTAGGLSVD